jgi:hypothetical protein
MLYFSLQGSLLKLDSNRDEQDEQDKGRRKKVKIRTDASNTASLTFTVCPLSFAFL